MDYICYSKIIIHQKTLPVKIYEIERLPYTKLNTNSTGISYQHYSDKVNNHILLTFFKIMLKIWKILRRKFKTIFLVRRLNYTSTNVIIENNAILTDPTAIANAFNKCFIKSRYSI